MKRGFKALGEKFTPVAFLQMEVLLGSSKTLRAASLTTCQNATKIQHSTSFRRLWAIPSPVLDKTPGTKGERVHRGVNGCWKQCSGWERLSSLPCKVMRD